MSNSKAELEQLIYEMLVENTGVHMLDSGGESGRHWQRNQNKTIDDFRNEPLMVIEDAVGEKIGDFYPVVSVSTFKHLSEVLELDDVCRKFNKESKKFKGWNGWISEYEECPDFSDWMEQNGLVVNTGMLVNSYNSPDYDDLSQTVLFAPVVDVDSREKSIYADYVLLQIHGGADVRGGYTDAKMFRMSYWGESIYDIYECNPSFTVYTDRGLYECTKYGVDLEWTNAETGNRKIPYDDEVIEKIRI